jgi:hypothetical protein
MSSSLSCSMCTQKTPACINELVANWSATMERTADTFIALYLLAENGIQTAIQMTQRKLRRNSGRCVNMILLHEELAHLSAFPLEETHE